MKIKFIILPVLFFIFSGMVLTQDYTVVQKTLDKNLKKPKFDYSISYPVIRDFGSGITAMNMFNRFMEDKINANYDTFYVWMADWDTTTTNHEFGSYYEAGDSVFYSSNSLISVLFYEGYYFSGAAHPNNSSFSVNYDLEKFRELTLDDFLIKGWEARVSELCLKSLKEQRNLPEGYEEEWLDKGAGRDKKNFDVFNYTGSGFLITFVTYQVGPYVDGPSEVFISNQELQDFMKK